MKQNSFYKPHEVNEKHFILQSHTYFSEISTLIDLLRKQKITFLFLKGLPLHLYYEKDIPSRLYADCDLLIHPQDMSKTDLLLKKRGYIKVRREFSSLQERFRHRKKAEESYIKIIRSIPVEFDIHREIVFTIPKIGTLNALYSHVLTDRLTELFLKNSRRINIFNISVPILTFEHLVVYLALHLFNHDYKGEFRYKLFDKIVRKEIKKKGDDCFKRIFAIVKEYKLHNYVYPSFVLLKKNFDTPIPPNFIRKLQSANFLTALYLQKKIERGISLENTQIVGGIARFMNLFFLSEERWLKKITVFIQPSVILMIGWVLLQSLKLLMSPNSRDN